jgi:hypothetical protein
MLHLIENDANEYTRLIQHVPGKLDSFTLELGPFEAEYLHDIVSNSNQNHRRQRKKWTLLVNDVDRYRPDLAHWMDREFSFLPRWRRDDAQISLAAAAAAAATFEGGGGGIGPHVDNYDVFLIQTAGTRTWSVGRTKVTEQQEFDALLPDLAVRILPADEFLMDDAWTFHVRAGDMLYVPPRVVHCGTATKQNDDDDDDCGCMTLSVGCRAPSAAELVARVAESLVLSARTTNPRNNLGSTRYRDANRLTFPVGKTDQSLTLTNTTIVGPSITGETKEAMKQLVLEAVNCILEDDSVWDSIVGATVTEAQRYSDTSTFPFDLMLDDDDNHDLQRWGSSPLEALRLVMKGQGRLERATGISFATSIVATQSGSSSSLSSSSPSFYSRLYADGESWQVACDDDTTSQVFYRIERGLALDAECLEGIGLELMSTLENLIERGFLVAVDEEIT